jgi:hypothetical protein
MDAARNASQYQLLDQNFASRWHLRCQWVNGDFDMSPFRGQLSGKPQPATVYIFVVSKPKHKGARRFKSKAGVRLSQRFQ